MKNLMVVNPQKGHKRYNPENMINILNAQIENSLDVGWLPDDIVVLSTLDHEWMEVKTIKIPMNDFCWTGSKMFGLLWLLKNNDVDTVWAHDLDAWQNVYFDFPEFKDVGAATYTQPKFNGGSVFWKRSALDIVKNVCDKLSKGEQKEEPTLNSVFKSDEYKNRVTVLNNSFNVGCSGFLKRYNASEKPIKVCHFHPYNTIAWEIHALDRCKNGKIAITVRLERILRKYYPELATSLRHK